MSSSQNIHFAAIQVKPNGLATSLCRLSACELKTKHAFQQRKRVNVFTVLLSDTRPSPQKIFRRASPSDLQHCRHYTSGGGR